MKQSKFFEKYCVTLGKGVHLMQPENRTLYQQERKLLLDAQRQASELINAAEDQKRAILQQAEEERAKLISEAKEVAQDEIAATMLAHKKEVHDQFSGFITEIESKADQMINRVVDYLFSDSSKREFIACQGYKIIDEHLIKIRDQSSATIKASESVVASIKTMFNSDDPYLDRMTFIQVADDDVNGDKLMIDLDNKTFEVDPAKFTSKLTEMMNASS